MINGATIKLFMDRVHFAYIYNSLTVICGTLLSFKSYNFNQSNVCNILKLSVVNVLKSVSVKTNFIIFTNKFISNKFKAQMPIK